MIDNKHKNNNSRNNKNHQKKNNNHNNITNITNIVLIQMVIAIVVICLYSWPDHHTPILVGKTSPYSEVLVYTSSPENRRYTIYLLAQSIAVWIGHTLVSLSGAAKRSPKIHQHRMFNGSSKV